MHLAFLVVVFVVSAVIPDLVPHPRLRFNATEIDRISKLAATDPIAFGMLQSIQLAGDRLLSVPVLVHNVSGPGQLLNVASAVVSRMYTLGFLHRYCKGQNASWATRAVAEMRAVSAFPDWNPPHFLDTAEISHGIAIGYDWFYAHTPEADKRAIEAGVLKNGFQAYLKAIEDGNEWARGDWNWNQVVNGGMTAASLSFADAGETAGLVTAAADTFAAATKAIRLAFDSYAPQGAWPEGAGYWGYGTRYALTASASLQSALTGGGDFGLRNAIGFNDTGKFCIYHMGPAAHEHRVFNWADASESACEAVNLMQLAAFFPALATTYAPTARDLIDGRNYTASSTRRAATRTATMLSATGTAVSATGGGALSASGSASAPPTLPPYVPGNQAKHTCCIWYEGDTCFGCVVSLASYTAAGSVADLETLLPLDYLFERRAVGFFRESWTDPNAAWLGLKGCNSTADHGDLDAGTWVLELGGQRWAIDMGSGSYALPGYWDKSSKDGARYSYYRKSTRGHNTLTFNGYDDHPGPSNQLVGGPEVVISAFHAGSKKTTRSAVVDMTSAYSHFGAKKIVRTFSWNADMSILTITDELEFGNIAPSAAAPASSTGSMNATWAMHTLANITILPTANASLAGSAQPLHQAVLSQGGVELVATVVEPASLAFRSQEVRLKAPQKPSVGVRKLTLEMDCIVEKIVVDFRLK